jgi:hypothetical protein
MNLLNYLLEQTHRWTFVFPQQRTLQRAIALAFGILCGMGKRTVTRAISFHGNTQKDWSADYKSLLPLSVGTTGLIQSHYRASHCRAEALGHCREHR